MSNTSDVTTLIAAFASAAALPAPPAPAPQRDPLRARRDAQRRFDAVGLPRLTSLGAVAA